MRWYAVILSLCLLLVVWSPITASDISKEEILKAVDEVRAPGEDFSFDIKITSKQQGRNSTVQELTVSVKDATKSLVKFTYPPENKGRVLLMVGQNLWIYMPTINKPIRISPRQRLVGQVSYGDVARVVYSYDYIVASDQVERVDEKELIRLSLTPKTKEATYGKIVLWVAAETYKPRKAQFYALSGKLLKTAYYKGYTEVLGKERPMIIEIHDELRKGEVSLMEYSHMQAANLPASYFQKEYLKYVR